MNTYIITALTIITLVTSTLTYNMEEKLSAERARQLKVFEKYLKEITSLTTKEEVAQIDCKEKSREEVAAQSTKIIEKNMKKTNEIITHAKKALMQHEKKEKEEIAMNKLNGPISNLKAKLLEKNSNSQ